MAATRPFLSGQAMSRTAVLRMDFRFLCDAKNAANHTPSRSVDYVDNFPIDLPLPMDSGSVELSAC